jgi:uncharacterized protein involved in type VI secretion and phage assembly
VSRVPGVVAGTVTSVDDPSNAGRIQISFDWMDGQPTSAWARVAAPMAGGKRGAFFQPEVSDEVLVSFDQGDVGHPYVMGYCWSSTDAPPYSGNQKKRGITTPGGHQLTFDDTDGSKSITLASPAGFQLKFDETAMQATVQTPMGISVQADDAASSVTVSLPTGNQLQLGPAGLTINVAAGTLNVTAASATITAAALTLDAGATTVTGALIVSGPVIANSIVSPTYTPGVGNLL